MLEMKLGIPSVAAQKKQLSAYARILNWRHVAFIISGGAFVGMDRCQVPDMGLYKHNFAARRAAR